MDGRVIVGMGNAEDAAVVHFPEGKALVQTLDFLTPVVNDPFFFGQVAAANALSDVYAMGAKPYVAMNIVCFPIGTMEVSILKETLRGGLSKIQESGALLVGGHSVQDKEFKYGLSVSGVVDPCCIAGNAGLCPGDVLLLNKPIGSGILATAVKAEWENAAVYEEEIVRWATHLNQVPGAAIARFGLRAATDVTGFGLAGHLLEMARASDCCIRLDVHAVPLMKGALPLAEMGLLPQGSFSNRMFCRKVVENTVVDVPILQDIMFDAQTSGGIVLAVPEHLVASVKDWMEAQGELVAVVGAVETPRTDGIRLRLC